jgi:hypothetical protein
MSTHCFESTTCLSYLEIVKLDLFTSWLLIYKALQKCYSAAVLVLALFDIIRHTVHLALGKYCNYITTRSWHTYLALSAGTRCTLLNFLDRYLQHSNHFEKLVDPYIILCASCRNPFLFVSSVGIESTKRAEQLQDCDSMTDTGQDIVLFSKLYRSALRTTQ